MSAAVKLLMTWDIIPGREQEYFEFVVRDFLPAMQRLGLEPNDAWFTLYGNQPKIMTSAQMSSLSSLQDILKTSDWDSLITQLMDYVENYKYKIVHARGGFQI
jgi:hypothetical protein